MNRTRSRTLLLTAVVVLTLTAGCSTLTGGDDPTPTPEPDIRQLSVMVDNQANATRRMSIYVTLTDGPDVLNTTASIGPGQTSDIGVKVPKGADLEATLAAVDGSWQTNATWSSDQCDPMQVDVTITADGWSSQNRCVPRSG